MTKTRWLSLNAEFLLSESYIKKIACVQNHCGWIWSMKSLRCRKSLMSNTVCGSIESVNSAIKKFLATVSLQDQDQVLMPWAGRWCSCVARYLKTVGKLDVSSRDARWSLSRFVKSMVTALIYDSTDINYPKHSSSCTHLRLDHTSYRHHPSSWRHKYYYHELYTRAYKHDNKLSSLLYLLPRLCFLRCLWLSLLARFNLNHLRSRRTFRRRNKSTLIMSLYICMNKCPGKKS